MSVEEKKERDENRQKQRVKSITAINNRGANSGARQANYTICDVTITQRIRTLSSTCATPLSPKTNRPRLPKSHFLFPSPPRRNYLLATKKVSGSHFPSTPPFFFLSTIPSFSSLSFSRRRRSSQCQKVDEFQRFIPYYVNGQRRKRKRERERENSEGRKGDPRMNERARSGPEPQLLSSSDINFQGGGRGGRRENETADSKRKETEGTERAP